MERSEIRVYKRASSQDFAALHPGYASSYGCGRPQIEMGAPLHFQPKRPQNCATMGCYFSREKADAVQGFAENAFGMQCRGMAGAGRPRGRAQARPHAR